MKINISLVFLSTLMLRTPRAMLCNHVKCRGGFYPRSKVERFPVPDDKVSWSAPYQIYQPVNYTSPGIHGKPWADPEIGPGFNPIWNSVDGNVSRLSYLGEYSVINGYPLNPIGRTGVTGRGVLGRWGPNHASDPVVTRWKRTKGELEKDGNNKPILQFIAIRRGDTGELALPGGMVDPGEKVSATAVREFQEEALSSLTMSEDQKQAFNKKFLDFFSENSSEVVFQGYIDDPRNTDNAWIESIAYNFHDETGSIVDTLRLKAGDDAVGVHWVDITPEINLYASHSDIVKQVYNKHTKEK